MEFCTAGKINEQSYMHEHVYCIFESCWAWKLKIFITRKKLSPCVVMDINETYCGDHCAIYINIDSLGHTSETNIMLYANYISITKEEKRYKVK